jgi:hypothetical protein
MKKLLLAGLLAALMLGAFPTVAMASPGVPLCLPGGSAAISTDCLNLGPAAYLSRMADLGLSFPLRGLPAVQPDSSLSYLPYQYARVTADQGRIYNSLEDAIAVKPVARYIEKGYDFVSFTKVEEVDGKKFYMIAYNQWMTGTDLSVGAAYALFMGLEFTSTPVREFGWVLYPLQAQRSPGPDGELLDRWFARWDVIQVYDKQEIEGELWYMVGPDVWLPAEKASLVVPNPQPPEGVDNGRWIEINLEQQTLSAYENGQLIYATLTSTGTPGFWTRPGLFQIQEKLETTPMRGAFEADRSDYYYLEDVPWTMYFDEARALHGAYWHTKFGTVQSHGCVNLSSGDSKWLYDWADVGEWVYVHDPSGETPEDPSLYGVGGA